MDTGKYGPEINPYLDAFYAVLREIIRGFFLLFFFNIELAIQMSRAKVFFLYDSSDIHEDIGYGTSITFVILGL